MADSGGNVPENRPGGGAQYSWQQVVMDTLNRIESRMLTRDEFAAHQQRFDGALSEMRTRIDEVQTRALTASSDWRAESIAEHKEFRAELAKIQDDVAEDRKAQTQEASKRRFTMASSTFAAGLSLIVGISLFVIQRGLG